jgi:hypothetical protein
MAKANGSPSRKSTSEVNSFNMGNPNDKRANSKSMNIQNSYEIGSSQKGQPPQMGGGRSSQAKEATLTKN